MNNRVQLQWEWYESPDYWEALVPAKDHCGLGVYRITIVKRPAYCDRGKWHVLVTSTGVSPLDGQEGFPRYFFKIENAKKEMELWANERQEVKAAFYASKPA